MPVATANGIGNCAAIGHEPTPGTITVARGLSDRTVRLIVGEDNAKVLDALDVMDSVAAQTRSQADCRITTADGEDPECLSMVWVETEIEICLDSGCCEHVIDLGNAPV